METAISPADLFTADSWETFVRWFWGKVDQSGGADACWPWRGYRRPDGYGVVQRLMGLRAHRIACMLARGPIPEGLHVLHSCDNPPCCNPAHLRAGTHSENVQEAYRRGRRVPLRTPTNARITAEQAAEIRARAGEDRRSLAAEFGLSLSGLDKVRKGETWAAA